MNKVFRVVWSKVRNCYVVASELAKSHTKAPARGVVSHTVVAGVLACVLSCGAVMPSHAEASADNGPFIGINSSGTSDINYSGGGATALNSIAIGKSAVSSEDHSIAIGEGASVYSDNDGDEFARYAIAIGTDAKATGRENIAIGSDASVTGAINSIGIGDEVNVTGSGSVVIGSSSESRGYVASSFANYSVGVGGNVYIASSGYGGTALGFNSVVREEFAVAIGADSVANDSYVVSFGHAAGDLDQQGNAYSSAVTRRLINISDGVDDTDAVSLGQFNNRIGTLSANGNYITTSNNATQNLQALDNKIGAASVANGTYVKTANTVNQNLKALDTQLKATADSLTDLGDDKAEKDASNVAAYAQQWANAIGTGTVSATDTKLVTGQTVYNALHDTNGTITVKEVTSGKVTAEELKTDTLEVNKEATFHDNATFEKDIEVKGTTTTEKLVVKDDASIGGDLTVEGETNLKDTMVDGDLVVTGTTTVQDLIVKGDFSVEGDQNISGDLGVDGKTTTKELEVEEDASIGGDLKVAGDTELDGDLDVKGKATFEDNVVMEKNLTVDGKATVGSLEVEGNGKVGGNWTVAGNQSVEGNSHIYGNQTVDGKSTVGSQEVLGDSIIDGNQTVKGDKTRQEINSLLKEIDAKAKELFEAKKYEEFREYAKNFEAYKEAVNLLEEDANAKIDDKVVLGRESWWKETLGSREFGYNKN